MKKHINMHPDQECMLMKREAKSSINDSTPR